MNDGGKYSAYYRFMSELEESTSTKVYDLRADDDNLDTPYIVCERSSYDTVLFADNAPQAVNLSVIVYLYTSMLGRKEHGETPEAENKVTAFLTSKGINYTVNYDWLDDVKLRLAVFSFSFFSVV